MSRKYPDDTAEQKAARRAAATVLVRLDQVIPEKRAEIERLWDENEERARKFRAIRGGKVMDANAFPSEGDTLRGAMVRGKDSPQPLPKKSKRDLGFATEFVRPDEDDTSVSTGPANDDRVALGEFVRGPETETVDVGGVPTVRRRR
jgi:hypothetical protein